MTLAVKEVVHINQHTIVFLQRSRFQDPEYLKKSPRNHPDQENNEEALFRANPPRELEHVVSQNLGLMQLLHVYRVY